MGPYDQSAQLDPARRAALQRAMLGGASAASQSGASYYSPDGQHVLRIEASGNQNSWLMKQLMAMGSSLGFSGAPGVSGAKVDQLLNEDKHQLWNEYGQYFSSKEQAQQYYNQVKSQQGKAVPPPLLPPQK